MNRRDPWRTALALLLVASAVLFAIGTTLERNQKDTHQEPAATAASEENTEAEGEEGEAHAAAEGTTAEKSSEEIFGIDVESPFFVALGVATSLAVAAGVWLLRRRELLLVVGLFAVAFTVLDVRELLHQLDESNEGIALLAILIALLHVAAAAAAAVLYGRDAQPVT